MRMHPLKREHLEDFVQGFHPENHSARKETGPFRKFGDDELIKRDKTNFDLFWLRDECLENADQVLSLEEIAVEIIQDLSYALEQLKLLAEDGGITPDN